MADSSPDDPRVNELLAAAVSAIGGSERDGQTRMAQAVWTAMSDGTHLAVQAGTGTGKSLAYLVPALRLAADRHGPVVVSTATIALQRQLVERDLPRLTDALRGPLGRTPVFAILKGRANYLCLNKLRNDTPEDQQDALYEPVSGLGAHVRRLHQWAASTSSGDRDEIVPGVPDQAWRQVSVTARECLGSHRCPFGVQCFSERARKIAADADVVVTNHALLAIDALGEGGILPEHRVAIIDEAHELVDRVTSVASGELSAAGVEAAVRRCGRLAGDAETARLAEAGNALGPLLIPMPAGRMDRLDAALGASLTVLRDAAQTCVAQVRAAAKADDTDPAQAAAAQAAQVALEDIEVIADRMVSAFELPLAERDEVVWLERPEDDASVLVGGAGVGPRKPAELVGVRGSAPAPRPCTWRRSRSARCWPRPCSRNGPWCLPPRPSRSAARSSRSPGSGGSTPRRWPAGLCQQESAASGPAWTSARRSRTGAAASCTWLVTCRRPGATGSPPST